MADLARLTDALQQAHAAGDTLAAQTFADEIRRVQLASAPTLPPELAVSQDVTLPTPQAPTPTPPGALTINLPTPPTGLPEQTSVGIPATEPVTLPGIPNPPAPQVQQEVSAPALPAPSPPTSTAPDVATLAQELAAAHAAGDVEQAQQLADTIRAQQAAPLPEAPQPPVLTGVEAEITRYAQALSTANDAGDRENAQILADKIRYLMGVQSPEDDWATLARKLPSKFGAALISTLPGILFAGTELIAQAKEPTRLTYDDLSNPFRLASKFLSLAPKMAVAATNLPDWAKLHSEQLSQEMAIFQQMAEDYNPRVNFGSPKWFVAGAESVAESILPNVAAGILGGPAGVYGVMTSQVFGQQYAESRLKLNRAPDEAFQDAAFMSFAELLGENIVLGEVFKHTKTLLPKMGKSAFYEMIQESFTEILQAGYDVGVLKKDETVKSFAQRVASAAVFGGLSGAVMAGAFHPVEQARHAQELRRVSKARQDIIDAPIYVHPGDQNNSPAGQVFIGGPNLTVAETNRLGVLKVLETLVQKEMRDESVTEGNTEQLRQIQTQIAALQKKAQSFIDQNYQITLEGFGVQEEAAPAEEQDVAVAEGHANQAVVQGQQTSSVVGPNTQTAVLNHPLLLTELPYKHNYDMVQDDYKFAKSLKGIAKSLNKLPEQVQAWAAAWYGPARPNSLESYGNALVTSYPEHIAEVHKVLEQWWPGQDYVLVFKGYSGDEHPMQMSVDPSKPQHFGNGAFSPAKAAPWGSKVAVLYVPKANVVDIGTQHEHEHEVIYKIDENVKSPGYVNLKTQQAVQFVKSGGQGGINPGPLYLTPLDNLQPNWKLNNTVTLPNGAKVHIPTLQYGFAGYGIQMEQEQERDPTPDVSPLQLDMFNVTTEGGQLPLFDLLELPEHPQAPVVEEIVLSSPVSVEPTPIAATPTASTESGSSFFGMLQKLWKGIGFSNFSGPAFFTPVSGGVDLREQSTGTVHLLDRSKLYALFGESVSSIEEAINNGVALVSPSLVDNPRWAEEWKTDKPRSAGVILLESDDRVWLVRSVFPDGTVQWNFPKGQLSEQEVMSNPGYSGDIKAVQVQADAVREVWEETGFASAVAGYLGQYERSTSSTRYFLGVRTAGQPTANDETDIVGLFTLEEAAKALRIQKSSKMIAVEEKILADIAKMIGAPSVATNTPQPETQPIDAGPLQSTPFLNIDHWEQIGPQQGSNTGGVFQSPGGTQYYVKFMDAEHLANEWVALMLYDLAGVEMPASPDLVKREGKIGLATEMKKGLWSWGDRGTANVDENATKWAAHMGRLWVASAWLANWDVTGQPKGNGYDNLAFTNGFGGPVPFLIEAGGSLEYRAQGAPKGEAFSDTPSELFSLLKPTINPNSAKVFKGVDKNPVIVARGLSSLLGLDATLVAEIVQSAYGKSVHAVELTQRILKRRASAIGVLTSQLSAISGGTPWDVEFSKHTSLSTQWAQDRVDQAFEDARDVAGKYFTFAHHAFTPDTQADLPTVKEISNFFSSTQFTHKGKPFHWDRTQPGEAVRVNWRGEPQVSPALDSLVRKFTMEVLSKFLPNARVSISYGQPFAGLTGAGWVTVWPNGVVHINLNTNHSFMKKPGQVLQILSHELGHAISELALATAPLATQTAVRAAHAEWKQRMLNGNMLEFANSNFLPMGGESVPFTPGQASQMSVKDWTAKQQDYWLSFDEWFAQQVARHLLGEIRQAEALNQKPMNRVEKFFAGIAAKLHKLYKMVKDKGWAPENWKPHEIVSDFLSTLERKNGYGALGASRQVRRPAKKGAYQALIPGVDNIGQLMQKVGLGSAESKKAMAGMDRMAWYIRRGWGILQMAEANHHVPGLDNYVEHLREWYITKMRWITRADSRVREWQDLGKVQAGALSKTLLDLTNMVYIKKDAAGKLLEEPRWPTPEEFQEIAARHGLDENGLRVYQRVVGDFAGMLKGVEATLIRDAITTHGSEQKAATAIAGIQTEMAAMRQRPYFPLSRFGDYTIVVKDANKKVVRMESFESELSQKRNFDRIRGAYDSKHNVYMSKIPEDMKVFASMPPAMAKAMASKLNLTEAQEDILAQIAYEYAPSRSFLRHLDQRTGVAGFSQDGIRAYANYFFHGANTLARLQHADDMARAVHMIQDSVRTLNEAGADSTKRVEILDYVNEHFHYIMNPREEWAALRSVGFLWYLGFNVKSAFVNLTQIPMVTAPYLSARFGDTAADAAIARAYLATKSLYSGKTGILNQDARFFKAQTLGIQQGFLTESQASELAAVSEGTTLQRLLPNTKLGRLARDVGMAGAYVFQVAEQYNRRITFRAAWDLAMKNSDTPYLKQLMAQNQLMTARMLETGYDIAEVQAYLAGRDAVERTQYEYASWNRAWFQRGRKSVITLFMGYLQNQLWNLRYAPGAGRMWLMMLLAAGLMGLPGAEDLQALIRMAARRFFGKDFKIEDELRALIQHLHGDELAPLDMWIHGTSRYSFGLPALAQLMGSPIPLPEVDLSGSLSMGHIVPGLEAFDAPSDFNTTATRAMTDVGGAVVGAAVNLVKAISSDDPDNFKRWERAMPSALRGLTRGYRYLDTGREVTSSGATLTEVTPAEAVAQMLSFTPTSVAQKWDGVMAVQEKLNYFRARRGILFAAYDYAKRTGDRETIADVRGKIKQFNQDVPSSKLRITEHQLASSQRARKKARGLEERNLPAQKGNRRLAKEVQSLYPESFERVPRG